MVNDECNAERGILTLIKYVVSDSKGGRRKGEDKANKISSPQSHTLLFGDFSQGEGV